MAQYQYRISLTALYKIRYFTSHALQDTIAICNITKSYHATQLTEYSYTGNLKTSSNP